MEASKTTRDGDCGGSDNGALLVGQAQAFVQAEEERFVAAQSRAATLLGLAGVTAGIGAGIATALTDRDFFSAELEILAYLLGGGAAIFLVWSALLAVGVLQQSPREGEEPEGEKRGRRSPGGRAHPAEIFDKEIAPKLQVRSSAETAQILLWLLSESRSEARAASDKADTAFTAAGRRLLLALALGLLFAIVSFVGTESSPQRMFLGAKYAPPASGRASLGGWPDSQHVALSIAPSKSSATSRSTRRPLIQSLPPRRPRR